MSKREETYFLRKKAYEIGYAAFMIAAAVKSPSLKESLEKEAVFLIDGVSSGSYERSRLMLEAIEYLLRFGADVNAIHPENSEVVVREINALSSAIAELEKPAKAAYVGPVNLKGIFSEKSEKRQEKYPAEPKKELSKQPRDDTSHAREEVVSGAAIHGEEHSVVKSAIRQSNILDKIRQSGNCRLKDIQEFLPDTSERTIRYDIQTLIEQGLVERVGNGGPATYYRVRAQLSSAASGAVA